MKRALLILLIVVILLTGIPILMGAGPMACPDCSPGVIADGCVAAFLAAVALLVALGLTSRLRPSRRSAPLLLLASMLERPPQLV